MLTDIQIDAGDARLVADKLTAEDIDKLVGVMKLFFQGLEEKYNYDWATKLAELDDSTGSARIAAQVAACIIEMEGLGFGVSSLQGGSDALYYKEKEDYAQYILIVHTKFYAIPSEFTQYSLSRTTRAGGTTGTAFSQRVEPASGFTISERRARRASRRRY